MKAGKLLTLLALLLLVPSVLAAECELFDSFEYLYENTDDTTHRVTFVLLAKSSDDVRVVFSPSTLIVIPGETARFNVTASADEPLEGIQSAMFSIRKGTDVVGQATAYFDLSCPDEAREAGTPMIREVIFYTAILLMVIIVILALVYSLLEKPRRSDKVVRESSEGPQERRSPINVDAMIRSERNEKPMPAWQWILLIVIVVLVIAAFIFVLSMLDPTALVPVEGNVSNASVE